MSIRGLKELYKTLGTINVNMNDAVDDAVRVTATNVLGNATKAMRKVSQGRRVKRGKDNFHTVSKEGDAPNVDTGRLIDSIAMVHRRGSKVAHVGTNVDYGAVLEITKNRPWLVPALEKELPNFPNTVTTMAKKQIFRARRR